MVKIDDNTKKGTEIQKFFNHGVLVKETTNKAGDYTVNNVLLNKMKNITQPNKYGYWIIDSQSVQYLIKALDKNNIREFLLEYAKKYGSSFSEYLVSKGYDTKNKDREKLLNHIEKCLKESSSYNPNKVIKNDQIKNDNYTSKNVFDVQYNGKKVIINNKTTGRKSVLDFDKLLVNINNPEEKIIHMENMQKLPAEILEFYANEGVKIEGQQKLDSYNKDLQMSGKNIAGGFYCNFFEEITLPHNTPNSTYIHEVLHAVDYDKFAHTESENEKLKKAFELGLKRYETAGYARNGHYKEVNIEKKGDCYYFSSNAKECWSVIGEMLFFGKCEGQEILQKFWPEFIELEKQAITEIQSKPASQRHL